MLLIRKQGGGYQYKVVEELGKGQFGTVFKAAEIDTKALKAIKVMRDDKNDENEMETMRQEDRILQSLNHPNIVKCERWHEVSSMFRFLPDLDHVFSGKKFCSHYYGASPTWNGTEMDRNSQSARSFRS